MNTHQTRSALRRYARDPRSIGEPTGTVVELHLLTCAECRAVVAGAASAPDRERDWSAIASAIDDARPRNHAEPSAHAEHEPMFEAGIGEGAERVRWPSHRWARLLAAAAVLVVAIATIGVLQRGDDGSDLAVAGPGRWQALVPTDPDVFTRAGHADVTEVTEWRGEILVLGAVNDDRGNNQYLAWRSPDGLSWNATALNLPRDDGAGASLGCEIGGVAVTDDAVVLPCEAHLQGDAGESRIVVAASRDLERWALHDVSEAGFFFGAEAGLGPNGSVVVQTLEATDPNTPRGAVTRIWTSIDLGSWTEIEGASPDSFVNAAVWGIRTLGDSLVLTGFVSTWEGEELSHSQAAVWQSIAGAPFQRSVLSTSPPVDGDSGHAADVIEVGDAFSVVGVVGTPDGQIQAAAWVGTVTDGFSSTTIEDRSRSTPDGSLPASIVPLADGTLLAVGRTTGSAGDLAWRSSDGGRTWSSIVPGPTVVGMHDGRPIGFSQAPAPTFWLWDPTG